jgi:cell division protein ZapE
VRSRRRNRPQADAGRDGQPAATTDPEEVRAEILHRIEEAGTSAGFTLADTQRAVAARLADLGSKVTAGEPLLHHQRGLYLWGPVGRGKTWLLDRFFDAVPVTEKSRFHFQRFFRDFNAELAGRPVGRASIAASLDHVIDSSRLLCFDEFYAHEAGDATLLTRLLEEILARQIPLVITSNYSPQGLLPDAELWTSDGPVQVSHRPFLRGIALLEQSLVVLGIDDGTDYRTTSPRHHHEEGFRAGKYVVPGTRSQLRSLLGPLIRAQAPESLGLSGGRRATPLALHDRQIAFTFSELCERPLSAGDILGLASRYTTWIITGLPRLADTTPEAAQRFVNLVDVLHDADVCLNIVSRHTLGEVMTGTRLPPDVGRAASRLALLRLETDHDSDVAATS